jgi:EAL domain-containing protein (putative c-di-GMP-specific phosphodiesterase class I)
VQDVAHAAGELRELTALGVTFALDDFGTGYSSLSHLMRFPVDMIKIDRLVVAEIRTPDTMSGLASALVMLGDTLGLQTVAEGIEDQEQLDTLRVVGCERGQGFFFAKPLPPEQIAARFFDARSDQPLALVK